MGFWIHCHVFAIRSDCFLLMGPEIVTVLVSLTFLKVWLAHARELAISEDSWCIIGHSPVLTGVEVRPGLAAEENVHRFLKTLSSNKTKDPLRQ